MVRGGKGFRDYLSMIEGEIAKWPGVTFEVEVCGRKTHPRLLLQAPDGQRQFVVLAGSPSDKHCGAWNKIKDVRHTLSRMGLTRS